MEKCGFKREMGERDGRGWGGGELAVVGRGGEGQGAGGGMFPLQTERWINPSLGWQHIKGDNNESDFPFKAFGS